MILFYNVLVTDKRASASGLNRADRLDIFKYALASFACIDRISKVIIFCQLDGSYANRWDELDKYIHTIFAGKPVSIYRNSPSNQSEWKFALARIGLLAETEPILYMGNDDHVFIDYDTSVLYEGLDWMEKQPKDQISTVHISSWTEAISTVYGLNDFTMVGRYWEAELLYPDACQIVSANYFEHIFFDLDMGDAYMRRTDEVLTNWYPYLGNYRFKSSRPHPKVKTIVPLRELVRHFDAYWHINVPLDACPMLEIPPGFFDGKIRLSYNQKADEGWYAWGPFSDCKDKKLHEDVPLFWRNRISEIRAGDYLHKNEIAARNDAIVKMMTAPHSRGYQTPYARTPAIWPAKYRACPDHLPLPLEQEYLKVALYS